MRRGRRLESGLSETRSVALTREAKSRATDWPSRSLLQPGTLRARRATAWAKFAPRWKVFMANVSPVLIRPDHSASAGAEEFVTGLERMLRQADRPTRTRAKTCTRHHRKAIESTESTAVNEAGSRGTYLSRKCPVPQMPISVDRCNRDRTSYGLWAKVFVFSIGLSIRQYVQIGAHP